jgi:hypothetical protein
MFLRLPTDEGLVGYREAYAVAFDACRIARLIRDIGARLGGWERPIPYRVAVAHAGVLSVFETDLDPTESPAPPGTAGALEILG